MAYTDSFGEFPGERIPVKVNSTKLEGAELNSSSVYDTAGIVLHGAARVGLFINISNEDATGTLDIDLEWSPDKGTTYVDLPITANSQTGADMTQISATGSYFKWWDIVSDMSFGRIRAELTQGTFTAGEGFTYGPCYWIIGRR